MIVEAQISIQGSKAAVWDAITTIEKASEIVSGIDGIEVVEKPARGLVGLRWRETRTLFGKPATAEKWITDAVENEFYKTRAESDGFVFLCTKTISERGGGVMLTEIHEFMPQTIVRKMMAIPMRLVVRTVGKKAIMQDLSDIKAAVEQRSRRQESPCST